MKIDDVVVKLRSLKNTYVEKQLWLSPADLPEHLGEFIGWAGILYSNYAAFIELYRQKEGRILAEETKEMTEINGKATTRDNRRTVDEKDSRITMRMSKGRGTKEKLEAEVKSATLHINGIQSLLKRLSDEAKGSVL